MEHMIKKLYLIGIHNSIGTTMYLQSIIIANKAEWTASVGLKRYHYIANPLFIIMFLDSCYRRHKRTFEDNMNNENKK